MLVVDRQLQLDLPASTRAVRRRYELAYAYRMVNTRQVDEYVEAATVEVGFMASDHTAVQWTVDYQPQRIEYVGSAEALAFFQWHEQQCRQKPRLVVFTDVNGAAIPGPPEQAVPSLILTGHLAFVTAGIWGDYPAEGRLREHVLPQHFGPIDLPLLETLRATQTATGFEVTIDGQLNKAQFEQPRFSRFVKDMTDIYDMSTRVDLTHEGQYKLDSEGLIEQAETYTETEVANAYNITYARTLKRL
ncbi:hypothetical protein J2I47_03780 [Fibrella sp. HMF5335]|uniref:Uncharacterized protein n=1 Tax=Fibrella rubiginis TaxID=2817060 RepID=A0A939GDS4_9BACT|nr:hypothetical protein [Fibrella rubiginis]MBO0935660.1 hypothetical protein [Fibrella rubiginis]